MGMALVLAGCGGDNPASLSDDVATIATNKVSSGEELPDATLAGVDGSQVTTGDLVGTPMVINFWYSTCEPCRREMPAFAAAHDKFADRVTFIGVNMYDSAVAAANFAERYGVTYEILLDSNGELVGDLGIALAPTTILVDATGTIVYQESGELTEEEITALINEWFPA
jgi:peroxiredoxin